MSIDKILETAILAPSGDNCQPWRLVVQGNQINIFNVPDKDTSLFNFRQRASFIAHGALIENIMIASSALGYKANINLFPDKTNPDLVAAIEIEKSEIRDEPLYPYIFQRATNRKPYKRIPLTDEQRSALLKTSGDLRFGKVGLVEGEQKDWLATTIGTNDRIVFENRYLHDFLFGQIRWTEEEAMQTRDGLYIKTLELSGPNAVGFRLLKNWPVVSTLNNFGLSRVVAKEAEKLCRSASAIGVVLMDGNTDEDFVKGGRLVQRVWLEATRLGLSFQPMTGLTFLIQRVLADETKELSDAHIRLINDAREKIASAFGLRGETIVMLFRVGLSDPPSAISLRLPKDKVVKID